MARSPNVFTAADGTSYAWPINHDAEDAFGKTRNLEHTALLKGSGLVIQQGDDGPLTIKVSGAILHKAQVQAFDAWFERCRTETIHFTDFAGDSYEVMITSFTPTRQRTLRNPRDPSIPLHYYKYNLEMEVIQVLSGSRSNVVT
jgi:hypothetical protein